MSNNILYVALAIIKHTDKYLVIRRNNPPYQGCYGLIGGKIEFGESINAATVREVKEETGIDATFTRVKAFLNEIILDENQNPRHHFIISIAETIAPALNYTECNEGTLTWLTLDQIKNLPTQFIPSDYKIILAIHNCDTIMHFEATIDHREQVVSFRKR